MREAVPEALQLWFADDATAAGRAEYNSKCVEYLVINRPEIGYFLEPEKSWYVCKEEDEEVAKQAFVDRGLPINYTRGQKYLGGLLAV